MIETALEKLARVLARQYHIEVIFEGNQAYTDGKKIVLPFFKEMTDELKADLNGFLDHEVAHCKFTEMGDLSKFPSLKQKLIKELTNACEDIRIERLMYEEFPGTAFNIKPLRDKMAKKHLDIWEKIPAISRLIVNIQWGMEGRAQVIDADIAPYMKAISGETSKLNSCKSVRDIIKVSEAIAKILRDKREEEKEDESEEGEESKGDKKKSDKKGGKTSMSAGEKGEDEGSDGESGEGEGEMSDAEGDKMDKMLTEAVGEAGSAYDETSFDIENFINGEIADRILEEPKVPVERRGYRHDTSKSGMRTSIPVTTRFDKVHEHSGKGNSAQYQHLRRKVRPLVQPIKTQLERVLKVKENARWQTEREQGKINSRSLSRLGVDPSYRQIFKEFTKTETNNVAVEILVDMSGSMMGKMETAKMAAIAIAEALKDLDIKFEVTGFTSVSDSGVSAMSSTMSPAERGRFNRFNERLDLHVFKDFTSNNLNGIEKLYASANNPDGECVKWAANRLALRKEKRKILMVLSDGQPAADGCDSILQADLKDKVKEIVKSGIECVGVGIMTDSVKHYYDDYVVINDISKLPTETMGKLSKIIGA